MTEKLAYIEVPEEVFDSLASVPPDDYFVRDIIKRCEADDVAAELLKAGLVEVGEVIIYRFVPSKDLTPKDTKRVVRVYESIDGKPAEDGCSILTLKSPDGIRDNLN